MCIFSQTIKHVSKTRVFGRVVGMRQCIAYEMRLISEIDVAMILPVPIGRANQGRLTFIDLSEYPQLFDDLERCFPRPLTRSQDLAAVALGGGSLPVHRVGAFDASFVPAVDAFGRLDPRFRLPETIWGRLPYSVFGFAVFQLRAGDSRVHPMAFWVDTRDLIAV